MSRIYYGDIDDLDSLLAAGRWEGRVKAVLKGKPAQKSFKELESALLALPEKRLIADRLCDESGAVCAIGALALHQGVDKERLMADWAPDDDDDYAFDANDIASWASRNLGVTETLAWLIQEANDETYGGATPEERWEKLLSWTRKHIRPGESA